MSCTHPKRWPIGALPELKIPRPLSEVPSEYRNMIEAGELIIPQTSNYRPFTTTLPRRTIMHCPKCGNRLLVPEKDIPRRHRLTA